METGAERRSSARPPPPPEVENVWQSLEYEIRTFMARQEESQRALATFAREQVSFLSNLHGFVRDQALVHDPSSPAEPDELALSPRPAPAPPPPTALAEPGEPALAPRPVQRAPPPPAARAEPGKLGLPPRPGPALQGDEAGLAVESWHSASVRFAQEEPSAGACAGGAAGAAEEPEAGGAAGLEEPAQQGEAVAVRQSEAVEGRQSEAVRGSQSEAPSGGHPTPKSLGTMRTFTQEMLESTDQAAGKARKDKVKPKFWAEEVFTLPSNRWSALTAETVTSNPDNQQDSVALAHLRNKKTFCPVVKLEHYNNAWATADLDQEMTMPPIRDGLLSWFRAGCRILLGWRFFEPMMCVIIALNAFNIGWTIDVELKKGDTAQQEINENIFLAIFVVELSLRLTLHGWKCLKILANAFDFTLVSITVVAQITKPLVVLWGGDPIRVFMDQVMVLRMMRLLRLARAVRLVASFRSLWKLVQGLVHCLGTMISAMILMIIILYIFACFGAEFITKSYLDDSQVGHIINSHFSSLPHVLLTLFQFISMDSTAGVYMPLIVRQPWLALYFLLLLIIVAIALMNLITALLVEDAISSAQMDEEMKGYYTRQKLKQLTPALTELFNDLDTNGDGYVQAKEVVDSIRRGLVVPSELQDFINPARMLDLFEALDVDRSGDLSETEFVHGLSCVAVSDVPRESLQILHLLRVLRKEIRNCRVNGQSLAKQMSKTFSTAGLSSLVSSQAANTKSGKPLHGHDMDEDESDADTDPGHRQTAVEVLQVHKETFEL